MLNLSVYGLKFWLVINGLANIEYNEQFFRSKKFYGIKLCLVYVQGVKCDRYWVGASFSCTQVFRRCEANNYMFSYICPNGTGK